MDTPLSKSTVPQPVRNPLDWLQVSVMDGYIVREILMPFLFGVGAFSSIGISVGALFELIRRVTESGLSLGLAMQIFVLKLPEFIVLAFPNRSRSGVLVVIVLSSSD